MSQNFETKPYDNPEMVTPSSPSATEKLDLFDTTQGGTDEQKIQETFHEIIDKGKDISENSLDAGLKAYHAIEDKILDTTQHISQEKTKKAGMVIAVGAGTIALAGMAMKKRNHRRHASNIEKTTRHIISKAKDIIPSN